MKMIDVKKLNFDYPDKRVLHDVSFSIDAGSVTALVGPNGAGKTTLLRCIAALDRPHSGTVHIGGRDTADDPRGVHHITGYLSDFFGLYDGLSLRQCLTYMAWCQKVPPAEVSKRVEDVAALVAITSRLEEKAGTLSRGYRQRLGIGLALIHDPQLIILDEPASGMDPDARIALSQLMRDLRAQGKTMIVSSHILTELEDYCTDMLVIKDGRVAEQVQLQEYAAKTVRTLRIGISNLGDTQMDLLRKQPNLKVTGTENNVVVAEFTGSEKEQQNLLRLLMAENVPVFSFTTSQHTLQDAYMNVTAEKK
ncbi:MAG TPA: ABC transporter ATP-binding protein [Patescibacteria group bacterium]|nr:ABC transporter ATP-binding protein [Patescibacteria group bacterium]